MATRTTQSRECRRTLAFRAGAATAMALKDGSRIVEADLKLTTYRVFWTNGAGRIASAPDVVDARDDAEAIREAQKMAQGRTVEVWDRSRRVAMLNGAERH